MLRSRQRPHTDAIPSANAGGNAALQKRIEASRSTGNLILADGGLTAVPDALLNWDQCAAGEKWWELVDLTKLDLSNNQLQSIPDKLFDSLSQLQVLILGNNKLQEIPESISRLSTSLTKLAAPHNGIANISDELAQLDQLNTLILHHNPLARLPESIGCLSVLEELNVENCSLTSLPESVSGCRALKRLRAGHNSIASVPSSLNQLQGLREVEFAYNRLQEWPAFTSWQKLERLDLRCNAIYQLPNPPKSDSLHELLVSENRLSEAPNIAMCPALSVLDIGTNKISHLPYSLLSQCKVLQRIDLRNNDVNELDPHVGLLTQIKALQLDGNPMKSIRRGVIEKGTRAVLELLRTRITDMPTEQMQAEGDYVKDCFRTAGLTGILAVERSPLTSIDDLMTRNLVERLKDIRLTDCGLQQFPQSLLFCPSLTNVDMSRNALDELPRNSQTMLPWVKLNLSFNQLREFPSIAKFAPQLEALDITRNRIQHIPEEINTSNQELRHLAVSQCGLQKIPSLTLAKLHTLDCSSNQVSSIPESFQSLESLEVLILENNDFSTIPEIVIEWGSCLHSNVFFEAHKLPSLKSLMMHGNPLRSVQRSVLSRGGEQLMAYLRQRYAQPFPQQQTQQQPGDYNEGRALAKPGPEAMYSDSPLDALDREINELSAAVQASSSAAEASGLKRRLAIKKAERLKLARKMSQA